MHNRSDALVTSLKEPFTVVDERRLKATIAEHLRSGRVIHILDLSEIETAGTRLMQTLLALFRAVHRKNGLFVLVITSPSLLERFEITGLDGVFPIFPDIDQAVQR